MAPPIVTLTLNPAIDMASTVPVAWPTHKVRTFDEHVDPGGGRVNVARVIHALGGETLALVLGYRCKSVGTCAVSPCADSARWILCLMCRRRPPFPR